MAEQENRPVTRENDEPSQEPTETWQSDQQGGQGGNQPERPPPPTGQPDQKEPER